MKRMLAVCAASTALAAPLAGLASTPALADGYIPPLPIAACHEEVTIPTPIGILTGDPCKLIFPR